MGFSVWSLHSYGFCCSWSTWSNFLESSGAPECCTCNLPQLPALFGHWKKETKQKSANQETKAVRGNVFEDILIEYEYLINKMKKEVLI